MGEYTELLYARPTFLGGVARIYDFGGVLDTYNVSPTAVQADRRAMAADWYAVGKDMRRAILARARELQRRGVHVNRPVRVP